MVVRDDIGMVWAIEPYNERVHDLYARFGGRAYAEPVKD